MLSCYEKLLSGIAGDSRSNIEGQMGLFDNAEQNGEYYKMPDLPELSKTELLKMEKETTGIYISGHPVLKYRGIKKSAGITDIESLVSGQEKNHDGKRVKLLGVISEVRKKTTRNNDQMAYLTLEDTSSNVEILVFPKTLREYSHLVFEGSTVVMGGRISLREERETADCP